MAEPKDKPEEKPRVRLADLEAGVKPGGKSYTFPVGVPPAAELGIPVGTIVTYDPATGMYYSDGAGGRTVTTGTSAPTFVTTGTSSDYRSAPWSYRAGGGIDPYGLMDGVRSDDAEGGTTVSDYLAPEDPPRRKFVINLLDAMAFHRGVTKDLRIQAMRTAAYMAPDIDIVLRGSGGDMDSDIVTDANKFKHLVRFLANMLAEDVPPSPS